jgi:predicted ATPase
MEQVIAKRYELRDKLGKGGMGDVFLARDRLTGHMIALKRVRAEKLDFGTIASQAGGRDHSDDYRLALALEFRTLASLRHPYIVSVLDYGFDAEEGQPFFAMEYIEEGQPLVKFARSLETSLKVRLLTQLLQALAYLHRREILHRDLKPQNVLVSNTTGLKVLDFGLALHKYDTAANLQDAGAGTLPYLAPEIFYEQASSIQSDLYAVGVMAYELFVGRYPYRRANMAAMVQSILHDKPDTAELDDGLGAVLDRLLSKDPHERYENADEVVEALCAASNVQVPDEDQSLRESFLQSARFVGRDDALFDLQEALFETKSRHGSAWLVAGESGVGKTRLLEEVRIRALVQGVHVLRGQASNEGLPYQAWRQVLRQLVLSVDLSEAELAVFRELIPDIDTLLGKTISELAPLEGDANRERLAGTISNAFKALNHPTVLLLEDLHWMDNSLEPLKQLSRIVADLPLLLVATYRNDEAPDIPDRVPGMRELRLERLDDEAIEELSASMLGEAGRHPDVLALLKRETEGNAFFMVEVVRVLADEAGRLGAVGQKKLPTKIVSGGVLKVVQRRLNRLPEIIQEWLKLIAIAERSIDLELTRILTEQFEEARSTALMDEDSHPDIRRLLLQANRPSLRDQLLTICAHVAVLEVQGQNWRFAHDKIRETILTNLSNDERVKIHRQVGEAMEVLYADNEAYAARLFEHFYAADDKERTIKYGLAAGRHAHLMGRVKNVIRYAKVLIPLLTDDSEHKAKLLRRLGDKYVDLREFDLAQQYYEEALALSQKQDASKLVIEVLRGLAYLHITLFNEEQAEPYVKEALSLMPKVDVERQAKVLQMAGALALQMGDLQKAREYFQKTLEISQPGQYLWLTALTLKDLAQVARIEGDLDLAELCYRQAVDLGEQMGNRWAMTAQLIGLADLAALHGDFVGHRQHSLTVSRIFEEFGTIGQMVNSIRNLGWNAIHRAAYGEAKNYFLTALNMIRRHQIPVSETIETLRAMSTLARFQGEYRVAQDYLQQAIDAITADANPLERAYILVEMGRLEMEQGNFEEAIIHLDACLELSRGRTDFRHLTDCLITYGRVLRLKGDVNMALPYHEESIKLVQERGVWELRCPALYETAWTLAKQGNLDSARRYAEIALRFAWLHRLLPFALGTLLSYAYIALIEGFPKRAVGLLGLVKHHPSMGWAALENRANIALIEGGLRQVMTDKDLQMQMQVGAESELKDVVERILSEERGQSNGT